ncbi:family 43 glycosylhydrolase [Sphingomonas sp. MMS24-JH45]
MRGQPAAPRLFRRPVDRSRRRTLVRLRHDRSAGRRPARTVASDNGRDWRFSTPEWPTKQAASSPTSGGAKVWAPSVVRAANGRWYMYVLVGSEVWVGTAPSPAGPWRDAHGGRPLIARDVAPAYHMIDAEAFVDDDGQAYLYWDRG